MSIEVFTGFAGDVGTSQMGRGISAFQFCLDSTETSFYSPMFLGSPPFDTGDYVAVAATRSLFPGASYVALAYRRLGVSGATRPLNLSWPVTCILFGLLGVFAAAYLNGFNSNVVALTIVFIGAGLFGLWRLWSIRAACLCLKAIQSPLRSAGTDRE